MTSSSHCFSVQHRTHERFDKSFMLFRARVSVARASCSQLYNEWDFHLYISVYEIVGWAFVVGLIYFIAM